MSDQADIKKRAVDIAERALAFEGLAREAFIQVSCQGHRALHAAVRNYLARPKQTVRSAVATVIANADPRKKRHPTPFRVLQNRYEIKEKLGAGGMGQVLKALDRQTGAFVAIKLIKASDAPGQDQRMRFMREARSAGELRHPNIVQIFDVGQVEGNLYMVMEYLPGLSLRSLIAKRQPDDPRPILLIMSQVTNALAFAHAKGVIHGDVKPDNIMVLPNGTAKLVDFGIARHAALPNLLVQGGVTPRYAAPEQFQQQDAHAPSDIWAIGVTLFESLTGRYPFRTPQETIHAPTPLLEPALPLSTELNRLLAQILIKNPQYRLLTADDLAASLSELAGQPSFIRVDEQSRDNPADSDGLYALPDLGFRSALASAGGPEAKDGISGWTKRRYLVEAKRREWVPARRLFLAWGVPLSPLALLLIFTSHWSGPAFLVPLIALGLISGLVSLTFIPTAVCLLFGAFAQLPHCRNCALAMSRTSRWVRFAKNRTEIEYGLSDCRGALKHGLWQEAAKLLAVHGREYVAESDNLFASLRLRLDFFECDYCPHHAARLTVEERAAKNWRPQERYFEAYWQGGGAKPSLLRRFSQTFKNGQRSFAEAARIDIDFTSFLGPVIAGGIIFAGLLAAYRWSAGRERIPLNLPSLIEQNKVCYTPAPSPTPKPFVHVESHSTKELSDLVRKFECFEPPNNSEASECQMFCTPR